MRKSKTYLLILLMSFSFFTGKAQNAALHKVFENYYEDRLKLFPEEATSNGDNRYNDLLFNTAAQDYRNKVKAFYKTYSKALKSFNRSKLDITDRTSYDLLEYVLKISLEAMKFHPEYIPATQFRSLGLTLGTWGAGSNVQPFKNEDDYNNWLKRLSVFKHWVDTAISNFNLGIASGVVLPKVLVAKMIPQMENLAEKDSGKNIFYGPVRNFPESLSETAKQRLRTAFHKIILNELIPSYLKLARYLRDEYLPKGRNTSGYNSLPNGTAIYKYFVKQNTTTDLRSETIYQIGLKEVLKIHEEMEKIKTETGFTGTLKEFYNYLTTDKKFHPFNTAEEVLNAYRSIQQKIDPNLKKLFSVIPKTPFEIRQTEAFRAASAAAQYFPGTPDGKRPAIFYAPIVDAKKYSYFSMEDLFMHEAIPGHHYQIALQNEDTSLPRFRRNTFITAFGEGWGLYAETLGKELNLYSDPYQYMGSLKNQIHRAIRLVVDVGLHTGKMNREQAIKYMMDNEPISDQAATAEIERYMSLPGQALSYKIGQLKIEELRNKYKKQLGEKFSLRNFHDAVLKACCLPLSVFENYMDDWVKKELKL